MRCAGRCRVSYTLRFRNETNSAGFASEADPAESAELDCFDPLGEAVQNPGPGARPIEEGAKLFGSLAMPFKFAVFEFDESVARAFGKKTDFNLAGFGHV